MKILLALDGSYYSGMALRTLQALELPRQTRLMVMTVIPELTLLGDATLQKIVDTLTRGKSQKAEERAALKILQKPLEVLRETGVVVESQVRWGKPAEEILKLAGEIRADLVVVGAKGQSDSARFPLGSVAQKVMKYANTSVLLVREKTQRIRRILFATDGSKGSEETASFLIELPLPSHSKVVVVTSLESHIPILVKRPTLSYRDNLKIIEELQEAEEETARSLITKNERMFQRKGYKTETLLLRGHVAEEILEVSETICPDLIALGAKGVSGVEAFLLGSVAQRIARFSRYSVLIVRPRSKQ